MRTENSNITTDSTEIKRMRTLWITVYQQTGHPRWNRQITETQNQQKWIMKKEETWTDL